MKHRSNVWHIIATASVSEPFSFVCFIIFLTKAFLDFELLVLCLVVVHKGISPYWPRGCTLTYWGKVTWTFQYCAQTLMALKTLLFFLYSLHFFFCWASCACEKCQCTENKSFLHVCTQSYCCCCWSFPHKFPANDSRSPLTCRDSPWNREGD